MRVVHLLPHRAADELNTTLERMALMTAGYDMHEVVAPKSGARGAAWFEFSGWRRAARIKPDIIIARDLDTLAAGVKVKHATGAKLVYFQHEAYSWMVENDVPPLVIRWLERRERRLISECDAFVASNPGILSRLGDTDKPSAVVMNCRDPQPTFVSPSPPSRQLYYLGSLHTDRFIKEMVNAMRRVDGTLVITGPRTTHSYYDWLATTKHTNVDFRGFVLAQESLDLVLKSDAIVAMLDPSNRNNCVALGNKVFDAMSFGRAVISTAGTANGNLVTSLGMGRAVAYNEGAFANGVAALLDDDLSRLGKNAYDACSKGVWNWKTQAKELVALIDSLA